ncbi:MurR/RpiR family transcriptional regulator, partial [Coprobacillus cateniformis]|nr:MurR/RpiR family transcriptional regulator [Coprobacillus cateniformis]
VLDICISSLMLHHMDTIEEVYSKLMNARAEWQNEKMK